MKKLKQLLENRLLMLAIIFVIASIIAVIAGDVIVKEGSLNISQDLIAGTNTLYVDSTNNRIGIGTTSPSTKLDVEGNARIRGSANCGKLYTDGSGNVLCGTDQGVTSESDPTVPASVKDGASWSEIQNIPAGFADGVDDVGGGAQNVFTTINAPAGTYPVADSTTDTLNLAAGSGITITGDSATDTLTIASDVNYLQRRVTGTCASNQAIRVINSDGTVSCVNIPSSAICTWKGKTYSTGAECWTSCDYPTGIQTWRCGADGSWYKSGTNCNTVGAC